MRRKGKKNNKKKIITIFLVVVLLILSYIANILFTNRKLMIFEKAIKDGVLSIQKVITYPVDLVISKVNENKEKKQMYNEYDNLKKRITEIEGYMIENEELKKQLEEMKSILELDNILSDYESINATVIGRDLNYFNDFITIDKGESSGISINMPVVVSGGLIGKVVKTSTFNSIIKLLTTNNSNDKISVKIQNKDDYIYGILSNYDKESNTYIIEGIAQNIDILEGSLVTTTGMGDIFPSGIVIGKIKGVSTDNFDLSKVLKMESDVDFNSINYVKVLKRGDL